MGEEIEAIDQKIVSVLRECAALDQREDKHMGEDQNICEVKGIPSTKIFSNWRRKTLRAMYQIRAWRVFGRASVVRSSGQEIF